MMTTQTKNQKEATETRTDKAPVFRGTVVSNIQDKTIVVSVETLKTHAKYRRKYRSTKRYQVDDPENRYVLGEKVEFRECAPVSRQKRHRVIYQ